jgi:23S rRNA-/tRNA-specific pseudouridylate synthase
MSFLYILFFLQLSILHTYPFQPIVITQPSFVLYARQLNTERDLLSDRYDDREETDGRPNYIHRAQVADSHPRKLLEFVYTVFPDVKRTQAKQWLQHESLLINDEPQSKFDLPLRIGDWVSVRAGKSKRMSRSSSSDSGKKPYGTLPSGLKIIYEDDSLFVVEKPHGLAVSSSKNVGSSASRNGKKSVTNSTETADKVGQKTIARRNEPATKTVHSIVSSYLGKRSGSVESKVFVVNWLDDDVSGLVIFAKSAVSRDFMLRKWNSFGVMYTVLCEGLLFPQQGTITTYMNEELPNVQCSLTKWDIAGMKGTGLPSPSISHYRTLESVSSSSLSGDRAKEYENTGLKLNSEVNKYMDARITTSLPYPRKTLNAI